MQTLDSLSPQFLTDAEGNRTAVVLSTDDFGTLIEDLEDLAAIAERRDEPTVSHTEVVAELRRDGLLGAA